MKASDIKNFNRTPGLATVEVWATRFGRSTRVVKRTSNGQFKNNKSAKQLLSA